MESENYLYAKLNHESFHYYTKEFSVQVRDVTIDIQIKDGCLEIIMKSESDEDELKDLFFTIDKIMALFLGCFPHLTLLELNEISQDLSMFLRIYFSNLYFNNRVRIFGEISPEIFDNKTISLFEKINEYPLTSTFYLISDAYKPVLFEHRLNMLLHGIEGLVDKNNFSDKRLIEIDYEIGISNTKHKGAELRHKLYYLFDKYYLPYDVRFELHIFNLFDDELFGDNSIIKKLVDTRNWYSHFFSPDEKPDRLKENFIYYFEILFYLFRLHLLSLLNIEIDENIVIEFYRIIHDWIVENNDLDEPLKSMTYKNNRMMKEMIEHNKKLLDNNK